MLDHQEPTVKRNYIDPWDLENIEYIHRHLRSSPEPSINDDVMDTPSPAGEPVVASTFYYLSGGGVGAGGGGVGEGQLEGLDDGYGGGDVADGGGGDDNIEGYNDDCIYVIQSNNNNNNHHEIEEHKIYDCTSGCYAGLDEELFYNSTKYESIHDDPSVGIYYTDIESSSSMERTSSSGGSTVSTLQLHTPGFGVRASGRRSIVLPKPIPHIEFPPAPPLPPLVQLSPPPASTECYHKVDHPYNHHHHHLQQHLHNHPYHHHHHQQYHHHNLNHPIFLRTPECHHLHQHNRPQHNHHHHHHNRNHHNYSTSPLLNNIMNTNTIPRSNFIKSMSDQSDELKNDVVGGGLSTNLASSYCRPSDCYDCINTRIPLYDLNSQVKSSLFEQSLGRRRHRNSSVTSFGSVGGGVGIDASVGGGVIDVITGEGNIIGRPPNNFGLSKRGLLQIDYSFNWNNLYHFISK